MTRHHAVIAIFISLFATPSVHGAVLHNNDFGEDIGLFSPLSVGGTSEQDVASGFTATADWTVNAITWTGIWARPTPVGSRNFTIEFFAESVGAPTSTAFYTSSITGTVLLTSRDDVWDFTATLDDVVVLSSGTDYFISITDDEGSRAGGMFWAASAYDGPLYIRQGDTGTWSQTSSNVTYALLGEITMVPLPAAVWFFGSGLIGLIALARRKSLV